VDRAQLHGRLRPDHTDRVGQAGEPPSQHAMHMSATPRVDPGHLPAVDSILLHPVRERDRMDAQLSRGLLLFLPARSRATARAPNLAG